MTDAEYGYARARYTLCADQFKEIVQAAQYYKEDVAESDWNEKVLEMANEKVSQLLEEMMWLSFTVHMCTKGEEDLSDVFDLKEVDSEIYDF